MRRVLWSLALALAACSAPMSAPVDAGAEPSPPEVAVLRDGDGGRLVVTFRGEAPVALSETEPARVRTASGTLGAPLLGVPRHSVESGTVHVTTASYRLDAAGRRALAAPGPGTTLVVRLGGGDRTFPLVRGDVIE